MAVFPDASRARRAERELEAVEAGGLVALLATAVISRRPDGGVGWRARGPDVGHLSARADTIATMLGVLLPPGVQMAGLTAAADTGRAGREAGREFGERFAREVAGVLEPGGSVIIAVVDDRWVGEVARGLRGYHRTTRALPPP